MSGFPLSEPTPIQDIFATGALATLRDAEFVRILFWAPHPTPGQDSRMTETERHIVAKIVMTAQCYEEALRELRRPQMMASSR